jgi:hypothetical protein
MNEIGIYDISYANHLLSSEMLVLRGDRSNGDKPRLQILHDDSLNIILRVEDGIKVVDMESNAKAGAKDRFDIHIGKHYLPAILEDLNDYIVRYDLTMDTKAYNLFDPTGTEHEDGLPLGETKPLTRFPASCQIGYYISDIVASGTMLYVDAENYPRRARYHIGGSTQPLVQSVAKSCFEITISSEYVFRFVKSMELANILL